jgi:hypothetical protein
MGLIKDLAEVDVMFRPVRTIAESELDAEIKEHEVMFLFVQTTPNAEALVSTFTYAYVNIVIHADS